MSSSLGSTADVSRYVNQLRDVGVQVAVDKDAGTIDSVPFKAIQKGDGDAPWIMTFFNVGNIMWGTADDTAHEA